ncbi:outer membrane immunogenic protein [Rhodoblastus acidophilus]|nr:outer membrane protein [Rhodoblastus acidophilus]MCW2273965.1 outer membrane immunogenic protein [Rhodoblastus acidophilus]
MRKVLLSTVALMAMAGSAFAADLPSIKAPPPVYVPPPPVFSWTGFYIGVEGGGDFRNFHDNWTGNGIYKDAGLIGGVLGYNWQFNQFVVGLEGDAAAVLGGDQAYTYNGNLIYNNTLNSTYAAAIRGRLGMAVWDRALLYVAGGVAFGDVKVGYNNGILLPASYTTSRTGWTIGAGVDYAFTPNWITRIEYRYVDLGSGGYYNYGEFVHDGVNVTSNQVMGAIMYKFGGPVAEPVVARY